MAKHYNQRSIQAQAGNGDADEEATVSCELCQLPLFIYLINSGLLWIKRLSNYNTPDLHDKRTMDFGKDLVKSLTEEYRRIDRSEHREEEEAI